jgi:hypothetical protein
MINQAEMGRVCNMHDGNDMYIQNLKRRNHAENTGLNSRTTLK